MRTRCGMVLALLLAGGVLAGAQQEQNGESTESVNAGVYGSGGAISGGGMYLSVYHAGPFWRVLNPGANFEIGLLGPTPKTRTDGVFSIDYQTTYLLHPGTDKLHKPGIFFLSGGYSGFFSNGHGVNYGGGLLWRIAGPKTQLSTISLEYREYYVPEWGRQPGFRLAYGIRTGEK